MVQSTTNQGDGVATAIGFLLSFTYHLFMNYASFWQTVFEFFADAGAAFILGAIGAVGGYFTNRFLKRKDSPK